MYKHFTAIYANEVYMHFKKTPNITASFQYTSNTRNFVGAKHQ